MHVSIDGSEFAAFGQTLRRASSDGLVVRDAARGMRSVPLRVRVALGRTAQRLPRRGGLAARAARSQVMGRPSGLGDVARLQVRIAGDFDTQRMDAGTVFHPAFRGPIVSQQVPPGYASDAVEAIAPQALDAAAAAALDSYLGRLLHG